MNICAIGLCRPPGQRQRFARVAEEVGYLSTAALSRAFDRQPGTPAVRHWRDN